MNAACTVGQELVHAYNAGMSDPKPITADQAEAVAKHLEPIEGYLSKLVERIRSIGYDPTSPLLENAVAAAIRVASLKITLEGMAHPQHGAENRENAAKPRTRIKKWGTDGTE